MRHFWLCAELVNYLTCAVFAQWGPAKKLQKCPLCKSSPLRRSKIERIPSCIDSENPWLNLSLPCGGCLNCVFATTHFMHVVKSTNVAALAALITAEHWQVHLSQWCEQNAGDLHHNRHKNQCDVLQQCCSSGCIFFFAIPSSIGCNMEWKKKREIEVNWRGKTHKNFWFS